MSLDYPKRADWLAVRAARNVEPQPRWLHVSRAPKTRVVRDPVTGVATSRTIWPKGKTLVIGTNKAKQTVGAGTARVWREERERMAKRNTVQRDNLMRLRRQMQRTEFAAWRSRASSRPQ